MWLDRLAGGPPNTAGAASPQPSSRPFSPVPRRTSSSLSPYVTSQRPGHSPRASSVSLVSNDSTVSLLSSSRKPNGSNLKNSTVAEDGPDPFETLDKILRSTSQDDDSAASTQGLIKLDDLEFEPDFRGLSLKELSSAEPDTGAHATAHVPRTSQTPEHFESERTKFEDLHRSISACDGVLDSVRSNMATFRDDLAVVSADIESLQARSAALNSRLGNRQEVEKMLGPIVEELSLSPDIISKLSQGHIDETWVKMLNDLDKRSMAQNKPNKTMRPNKAAEDLGPLLEKLTAKCVERIRDFLVTQIKSLRSPNINAQLIQQQSFLRFKDLYTFLHKHHAQLAEEIAQAYMNTMRWYYLTQFSRYEKALNRLKMHIIDKSDLLGQDDTTRKTTVLSGSRVSSAPHDAFNLGRRFDMVKSKNTTALPAYVAEEDQSTHYLEVPFRHFNLALIDNATAEYAFLASFFTPALSSAKVAKNFQYIFEPTFELGHNLTKTLIGDNLDALGVLLSIRLNQHSAFELQRRRVPAVEGYVNGTNMLLWPRLQVILDRHCESIRALTGAIPSKAREAAKNMTTAPHLVTQRFGQLLQGFLALSAEAGDDEPVSNSLRRLRTDVEAFLTKQSQGYGSDSRKSQRFLYNNYSLILTIIGDMDGKIAEEQQQHFERLKTAYQEDS